jgi:putative transposase
MARLAVMDGLLAPEFDFKEEFPKARVHLCHARVARNVLVKAAKRLKTPVAVDLRSAFSASSREEALESLSETRRKSEREIPVAVTWLHSSLASCLTLSEKDRISLRTTNMVERLEKQSGRRTKVMEIVTGERVCYILLSFISPETVCRSRSKASGKVGKNVSLFGKIDVDGPLITLYRAVFHSPYLMIVPSSFRYDS